MPVLRALFTSAEFRASRGQKVRRPYEDMIGTLRTLGYRLLPTAGPRPALRPRGPLLARVALGAGTAGLAAAGRLSRVAAAWGSAGGLLERWNMHQGLAGGWWPDRGRIVVPNRHEPAAPSAATYGGLVDGLAPRITGGRWPRRTPPRC